MKHFTPILFLGLASIGLNAIQADAAKGQAPSNTAAPQAGPDSTGTFRPGAGTVIAVELVKSIDTKKVKSGDPVEASVEQDLLYKGKIIIPHDAKVLGHVSEVTPATKEQPTARLGLVFEKIVLKDKKELPMQYPAVVTALAAPMRMRSTSTTQTSDMPVQMEKGRTSGGAAIDAVGNNSNLAGANMRAMGEGAIGASDRGVIGLKHLTLETEDNGMTVVVSSKGDVKLESAVQMVLRVSDPPKK
jgi:hypothetical protein